MIRRFTIGYVNEVVYDQILTICIFQSIDCTSVRQRFLLYAGTALSACMNELSDKLHMKACSEISSFRTPGPV